MEIKYLVRDPGRNSYQQRDCVASYTSDVGTAIQDFLPSYLSLKGDSEHEVIPSTSKEFNQILKKSAGKLERKIEEIDSELKIAGKNMKTIINSLNSKNIQYLIREKDAVKYLKKGTFENYMKNIAEAIHEELPTFIEDGKVISSDTNEFREILREELFGTDGHYGLEQIADVLRDKLDTAELNYKIISEMLTTGDSPELKELDKQHEEAIKRLYELSKD